MVIAAMKIELLGINELKDALNDYAKHKAKKREVCKFILHRENIAMLLIIQCFLVCLQVAKVAEKDTPFYDTATKTFIGRFSHDINQVD